MLWLRRNLMKLRIGKNTIKEWQKTLKKAGDREIGGILFGEHVGDSDFKVIHATKQTKGGNQTHFKRDASKAIKDIERLSAQHENNHERFNYLGEWHSHPNAPALPSAQDEATMHQLLIESDATVNFLVLIIIRLSKNKTIEMSAQAYLASDHIIPCDIEIENSSEKP